MQKENLFFFSFLTVLPNLKFGSIEYQHFQCEKRNNLCLELQILILTAGELQIRLNGADYKNAKGKLVFLFISEFWT